MAGNTRVTRQVFQNATRKLCPKKRICSEKDLLLYSAKVIGFGDLGTEVFGFRVYLGALVLCCAWPRPLRGTGALRSLKSHFALLAQPRGGEFSSPDPWTSDEQRREGITVPLELAELAAGLPFAVSFAMAGAISALREGRRRIALNEAMHELRRPLQAIALSASASAERAGAFESSLRMAAAAADRLDCEINGRSSLGRTEVTSLRPLAESAVERWQVRASLEKRVLSLKWEAGDPLLPADAVQLGQVLDNLISNGLDHGSGEVVVEAKQGCRAIRLVVLNQKRAQSVDLRRAARYRWTGISGRHRHGHGLRIVRRVAARHGGSFHLRHHRNNCEALLELPLCGGPR